MHSSDRHHIDRTRNPAAYDAAMKRVREKHEKQDSPETEEQRTRRAEQAMERAAGIR